jgi:hypothetical protein
MADRSLLLLFDEVRGKTLQLLQGVSEEQARWSPAGLQNHILWHSGHCYVLVECLSMQAIGQPPRIPRHWQDMFDWKSRPSLVPEERWPSLANVKNELKNQYARLRHLLGELSEEQLAGPVPGNASHTVRYAIVHGLHDEACHSGEIWLLRKLLRTPASAK